MIVRSKKYSDDPVVASPELRSCMEMGSTVILGTSRVSMVMPHLCTLQAVVLPYPLYFPTGPSAQFMAFQISRMFVIFNLIGEIMLGLVCNHVVGSREMYRGFLVCLVRIVRMKI
jgi:hypothetical protein